MGEKEKDEKDKVIAESLKFCHTLSTNLYIDVSAKINKDQILKEISDIIITHKN